MENVKLSPAQKFWKTVKSNPIVVLLVVVGIIVGFTKDNFFSWRNFGNLASNTAVRFLIALGVSGCLITKGTDLSAGRQVGFAACLAGVLLQRANYAGRLFPNMPEMNMGVVLLIVLAIGAVFGLLNGLIIAFLQRAALHRNARHADHHLRHFPGLHRRTADRRLPGVLQQSH